jgi:hypothetical protein
MFWAFKPFFGFGWIAPPDPRGEKDSNSPLGSGENGWIEPSTPEGRKERRREKRKEKREKNKRKKKEEFCLAN